MKYGEMIEIETLKYEIEELKMRCELIEQAMKHIQGALIIVCERFDSEDKGE